MYLQERKKYDPISTTQIVQIFSEQTGLELSWRIIARRIDYLSRLQASIFQLCTPDPETGIPIMTKEAWALATKVCISILYFLILLNKLILIF